MAFMDGDRKEDAAHTYLSSPNGRLLVRTYSLKLQPSTVHCTPSGAASVDNDHDDDGEDEDDAKSSTNSHTRQTMQLYQSTLSNRKLSTTVLASSIRHSASSLFLS